MDKPRKIGELTERVISLLDLDMPAGHAILLGESNVAHMKSRHPDDYKKYGQYIATIVSYPDYVGKNPADGSIEFVKEFLIGKEYVKVAVRVTAGGALYARSMYRLNANRVKNFIEKGTLKKV